MSQSVLIVDGMHTAYRAHYAFPLFSKSTEIREIDRTLDFLLDSPIFLAEDSEEIAGTLTRKKIEKLKERGYIELSVRRPVNLVYTFLGILVNQMNLLRLYPQDVVVVWEGQNNFKKEIATDYKADRAPMSEIFYEQIDEVQRLLANVEIAQTSLDGHEADDLIGAYARKSESESKRVFILSSDHDMWQLISEKVVVIKPDSDALLDLAWVNKRYQLSPKQLPDVWALTGDATDNIVGLKGIGESTASKWIQRWGSIEALYASDFDKISESKKKLVLENREMVFRNKELIRLDRDVLFELRMGKRDENSFKTICQRSGYRESDVLRWLVVFSRQL